MQRLMRIRKFAKLTACPVSDVELMIFVFKVF